MKKTSLWMFITLQIIQGASASTSTTDAIETSGDVLMVAMPLTTLGVAYYRDGNEKAVDFSYEFLATQTIVHTLKFSVNEKRPNGGNLSFPSGHTASAFSSAAFVQTHYGWKWGIPTYALASYVGWTRVKSKWHWTHDVIAGAAFAVGTHYGFEYYRKRSREKTLSYSISFDGETAGIQFSKQW